MHKYMFAFSKHSAHTLTSIFKEQADKTNRNDVCNFSATCEVYDTAVDLCEVFH